MKTKQFIVILTIIIGILGVSSVAKAQEVSTTTSSTSPRNYLDSFKTLRQSINQDRREALHDLEERRQLLEARKLMLASTTKNFKDERQELRASTTEALKDLKNERKDTLRQWLDERRQITIKMFLSIMINRFEAAFERLSTFIARIEGSGRVTDNSQVKLDEAKTLVTAGQNALKTLPASLDTIFASSTPQDAFKDIKELISQSEQTAKDAHAKVVEAIRLIENNHATSTSAN